MAHRRCARALKGELGSFFPEIVGCSSDNLRQGESGLTRFVVEMHLNKTVGFHEIRLI